MPKPAERPSGSTFIYFRPAALAAGVTLVHKVYDGKVDLQFAGQASRLAELHARWRATLPASMQLEQAGKSAAVRIAVPPIDLAAPFAESEASARQALAAGLELVRWYVEVYRGGERCVARAGWRLAGRRTIGFWANEFPRRCPQRICA
jgi:hypothetical protein